MVTIHLFQLSKCMSFINRLKKLGSSFTDESRPSTNVIRPIIFLKFNFVKRYYVNQRGNNNAIDSQYSKNAQQPPIQHCKHYQDCPFCPVR